jgi:hypothetical protein
VNDVRGFALAVAVLAGAGLLAVLSNRLSQRLRVPAPRSSCWPPPVASDLVPALGRIPIVTVQRGRGKSDPIDAHLAVLAAQRLDAEGLPAPRADGAREASWRTAAKHSSGQPSRLSPAS